MLNERMCYSASMMNAYLLCSSGSVIIPLSEERLVSVVSSTTSEQVQVKFAPGQALFLKGDTVHAGVLSYRV